MNCPNSSVSPPQSCGKAPVSNLSLRLKKDFYLLSEVSEKNLFLCHQFPDRDLQYFEKEVEALSKHESFQCSCEPIAAASRERFWCIIDYYQQHGNLNICGSYKREVASYEDDHYFELCLEWVKDIVPLLPKTNVTREISAVDNNRLSSPVTRPQPRFSGLTDHDYMINIIYVLSMVCLRGRESDITDMEAKAIDNLMHLGMEGLHQMRELQTRRLDLDTRLLNLNRNVSKKTYG